MTVLSDEARAAVHAELMRDLPGATACSQDDLMSAIRAVDNFFAVNTPAFYATIPEPAASGLDEAQKILLFRLIVRQRYAL